MFSTTLYPFLKIKIGDAKSLKICNIMCFIVYVLIICIRVLWFQVVAGFIVFGCSPLFTNHFAVYFNDFCPIETRGYWIMTMNIFFPVSGLFYSGVFFIWRSWVALRIATVIITIPTIFILNFYLMDNPMYSFNKNDIEKAIKDLHKISKINESEEEFIVWRSRIKKEEINNKCVYYVDYLENEDKIEIDKSINYDDLIEIGKLKDLNDKKSSPISNNSKNQLSDNDNTENRIEISKENKNKKSFTKAYKMIFSIREEKILMFLMALISIHAGYSRNYVSIQLSTLKNIHIISIVFYLVEIIAFYLQANVMDKDIGGRKRSIKFISLIGFICSTIIVIGSIIKNEMYNNILVLLILRVSQELVIRLVFAMSSEIFSRDIVSYTHGINLILSRIFGTISAFLNVVYLGLAIFILACLNLSTFISMFHIREVKGLKIFNTLEEKYNLDDEDIKEE